MERAMETAVTEMAAEATDSGIAEAPELPEVVLTPADIYDAELEPPFEKHIPSMLLDFGCSAEEYPYLSQLQNQCLYPGKNKKK